MGDSFGKIFRITTWGESHGAGVGVVIDGCPSGLPLNEEDFQYELDRRRPGQSKITTQRKESDIARILSGVFEGRTTGTSISVMVSNEDAKPHAYDHLKELYRPSHADFTYEKKFGLRDWKGGGRASARETVGRVAAGTIAKKLLRHWKNIQTIAWVEQIHDIKSSVDKKTVGVKQIEASIVRCPDSEASDAMIERIHQARKSGDSVGGIIRALCAMCLQD